MLVSAIQQRESTAGIHKSPLFWPSLSAPTPFHPSKWSLTSSFFFPPTSTSSHRKLLHRKSHCTKCERIFNKKHFGCITPKSSMNFSTCAPRLGAVWETRKWPRQVQSNSFRIHFMVERIKIRHESQGKRLLVPHEKKKKTVFTLFPDFRTSDY